MATIEPAADRDDLSVSTGPSLDKIGRLMPYKVKKFLLVASLYDYFMLEEDGRLQDLLLKTYQLWHLGYVPQLCPRQRRRKRAASASAKRNSTWSWRSCASATWTLSVSAAR